MGKTYDAETKALGQTVLYDAKDLTTHAVIIGMTGSGKTGLGIGILEEALMDNIPLIAIDPKGDLSNLLLSFPELSAERFRPWVNEQEAANKGQSPEAYAEAQAALWKKGLSDWGQDEARIAKMRQAVEFSVYTPGGSAGIGVSVLRSFTAPPESLKEDKELYTERIQSTVTSLLALMGRKADPIGSKEHSLLANILKHVWDQDQDLDLAGLIQRIQDPPFERIGVMDIEQFYPAKKRLALAMELNNLLASPGFEVWLKGQALDIQNMLFSKNGKPQAAIFSINHLSESERMFFVSMLLNEVLAWMRTQSGTSSLRALLYMDEIFGYLPPGANPPSKIPMLRLLKQARAFGLGLVLSTQNPVDLDYKALSNAGTWFIGRLQTEQDKDRVLQGLQGASPEGFDKKEIEKILSGLGKRVFLLHNVHEDAPVIFHTRWVMSYLAGPMTREQIKRLMAEKKKALADASPVKEKPVKKDSVAARPSLPSGVPVYYLQGVGANLSYIPAVAGFLEVHYSSATHKVNETLNMVLVSEIGDGPVPVDWDEALSLSLSVSALASEPQEASFMDVSLTEKAFNKWQKDLLSFVRQKRPLSFYKVKTPKLMSKVGETEGEFRARLAHLAREERDETTEALRKKYAAKLSTLTDRLQRAERTVAKEAEQARQKQMETLVNVGTTLLGAFMGRKVLSRSTTSRVGSTIKSAGRMQKEQGDIARAEDSAETIRVKIAELEAELANELTKIDSAMDSSTLALETVLVKAKSTDINLEVFTLLWLPYTKDKGVLRPAWS